MNEYRRTVNSKGQVTIPAEVRRRLGIKPQDRVIFQVDGTQVRLRPASSTLEMAYGSVPALARPLDFKAVRDLAVEEHVQHVIDEMKRE